MHPRLTSSIDLDKSAAAIVGGGGVVLELTFTFRENDGKIHRMTRGYLFLIK